MDTASSNLVYNTQREEDTINYPLFPLTVALPMPGDQYHSVVPVSMQSYRYSRYKDYFTEKNNCLDNNYKSERFQICKYDYEVIHMMSLHLLNKEKLYRYGYPMKILNHVMISYTPYPAVKNANNDLDSGHGSSSSVEHSDQEQETDSAKGSDSEKSSDSAKDSDNDKSCNSERSDELSTNNQTLHEHRICIRCQKDFYMDQKGNYVTEECCYYHWGKNIRPYNGSVNNSYWSCCKRQIFAKPCTTAKLHVWTGLVPGSNGPYTDFVYASPPKDHHDDVYGLDCEMCFSRNGLELTRVSLVNMYGRIVYDTLVKPKAEIIDYNSRFSGITEEDLKNVTKTLEDVQTDLLQLINSNTILVGHGLESDLRVLRLVHTKIIDTSIIFSEDLTFPYRQSLKKMAFNTLNRKIQESTHDSIEDSRAAMDLVMRQLREDFLNYEEYCATKAFGFVDKGPNLSQKPRAKDLEDFLEYQKKKQIQKDFKEIVKMRAEK